MQNEHAYPLPTWQTPHRQCPAHSTFQEPLHVPLLRTGPHTALPPALLGGCPHSLQIQYRHEPMGHLLLYTLN